MSRDYPPGDEAGFLAFVQSLPSRQLYEAIKEAEPLTKLYSFRGTQNRLRHYEKLPRYLEGFLVCGDAACTLSPVHAMGMTAALISSQTLAGCLAEQGRSSITGLARRFQRQLRQDLNSTWQTVTNSDRSWPASEVAEEIAPVQYLLPKTQISLIGSQYRLAYPQL
jgi:2-polyprenyl-6-methoxyphenol hydroxylase-like FAD-dependent oxidoreductase